MFVPTQLEGDASRPARSRGFLRALLALLVVLLATTAGVTFGGIAQAQRGSPTDVHDWSSTDGEVMEEPEFGPLPEGFVTETHGDTEWVYPASAERIVLELAEMQQDTWDRITSDLGETVDDRLIVRVARDPEEMAVLAPLGRPPPGYAVGVAYPRLGTIVLTLSAPESWERPDMEKVFTHELSHVALYRAVDGHRPPRWFVEGVAIYQANENSLERIRTLWAATIAGNIQPLRELSARFPARPHRVNVAYAQSADMVGFMRNEDGDEAAFHDLIDYLEEGMPFSRAVRTAYGESLPQLEVKWREALRERYTVVPFLLSGSGLWVLASILLVMAWARRRRQHRQRMAEMEAQENAEDAALQRAEDAVTERLAQAQPELEPDRELQPEPALEPDEEQGPLILVTGDPPQGRDADVPTVEYDGHDHTLH